MGDAFSGVGSFIGDTASAAVSSEGLPITLPLAGAAIGGIAAGGQGALEGGLSGLAAGQLFGSGSFAPFSTGDQSVFDQIIASLGGGAGAAGGVGADTSGTAPLTPVSTTPIPAMTAPVGAAAGPATGGGPGVGGTLFSPDASSEGGFSVPGQGYQPTFGSSSDPLASVDTSQAPTAVGYPQNLGASMGSPVSDSGVAADTGTGPGSSAKSGGSTFKSLLSDPTSGKNWLDFASANPNVLLGAAGLGYEALSNNQNLPQQNAIQSAATGSGPSSLASIAAQQQQNSQTALGQAQPLIDSLSTGQLPPGAQASVDSAVKANQAAIRQQYASMGLSGSTMETEALNNAVTQGQQQKFQIAQQMAQTGISLAQVGSTDLSGAASAQNESAQLLQQLMTSELNGDQQTQDAILKFVEALAGAGGGVNLKLA